MIYYARTKAQETIYNFQPLDAIISDPQDTPILPVHQEGSYSALGEAREPPDDVMDEGQSHREQVQLRHEIRTKLKT